MRTFTEQHFMNCAAVIYQNGSHGIWNDPIQLAERSWNLLANIMSSLHQ
jgi:hypothetical protein